MSPSPPGPLSRARERGRWRFFTPLLLVLGVLGAMAVQETPARADGGEAGLVIQHGDGSIDTYCVAFGGESISGQELLRRANIPVVQFGGLVCAVGTREGCFEPSSVESCVCQSYAPTNTYWSFFIQRYGKGWQYSSFGFTDARTNLKDGDMHAWRWGKGTATNAPAPAAVTFEQVCGHAPRGGAQIAGTIPATPVQPQVATSAATAIPATAGASLEPQVTASLSPASATLAPQPSLTAENTPLIVNHGTATAIPEVPATGNAAGEDSPRGLIGFAAVVAGLGIAIAGALAWRRYRGA